MSGPAQTKGIAGLLFWSFTWRHWRREWRSTLLLVALLALGVAVFLSIRLANRAAVSGFTIFTESLAGESDFVIRPKAGGQLPETVLWDLRESLDPLPVAVFPVIEAQVADGNEETFQLVGVDLVGLRNALALGSGGAPGGMDAMEMELGDPEQVFVAGSWAREQGKVFGGKLRLMIHDREISLKIAGLLEDDPARPSVPKNLVLMDLPGAGKLLRMEGAISRAELVVPPGAARREIRAAVWDRLNALGSESAWVVETSEDRRDSAAKMTQAFRLNLTVLSSLALVVGAYLILQALEASVVRRRAEIAVQRSLGVEPGAIRRQWVGESLALGLVGGAVGVLLGWAMAQASVGAIARTVNSLYHATTTESASLHPGEALVALAFGVVASLVAGWLPARDAAATPPAQVLRTGSRSEGPRWLRRPLRGIGLILAAAVMSQLPPLALSGGGSMPLGGYLAAATSLIGFSILSGVAFVPMGRIGGRLLRRFPAAHYAASQWRRPTGRHRLAAAGLVTALGMAAGMGVLVHSFEGTLTAWISQLLRADLYVATAGSTQAGNANAIGAERWQSLASDPEVAGIDTLRRYPVEFRAKSIHLAGAEYSGQETRSRRFTWLQAPADPDPRSLESVDEDGVAPAWVNEAFSRRFQVDRGAVVEVPTPQGEQPLRIEGVYTDYSDERGTVLIARRFTERWFDDSSVSSVAVYLHDEADAAEVRSRWAAAYPALVVRENARLRSEALRVFHQTFAVTYALEAIGIAVAVAGLGMALASLLVERREELNTLKSIGFTRRQIASGAAVEGAGLAVVGLAGGYALALVLGAVLIYVINRQSFGWTLEYRVPWSLLVGLAFLTLAASVTVGAAVGHRGARLRSDPQE